MQLSEHKNRITQILIWLTPTTLEVCLYLFIGVATIALSNISLVRDVLYATGDFNPIGSAVDSITQLLERLVGERVAGSLSLAIFWGLVGLVINGLWWVASNFSTELNNDLVFSNYVHPKNYDPKSPLREFLSRSIFRAAMAIVFFFYINFVVREALPHLTTRFNQIIAHWDKHKTISGLIFGVLAEILMLHTFVVLTRLMLLRKQVFNG